MRSSAMPSLALCLCLYMLPSCILRMLSRMRLCSIRAKQYFHLVAGRNFCKCVGPHCIVWLCCCPGRFSTRRGYHPTLFRHDQTADSTESAQEMAGQGHPQEGLELILPQEPPSICGYADVSSWHKLEGCGQEHVSILCVKAVFMPRHGGGHFGFGQLRMPLAGSCSCDSCTQAVRRRIAPMTHADRSVLSARKPGQIQNWTFLVAVGC